MKAPSERACKFLCQITDVNVIDTGFAAGLNVTCAKPARLPRETLTAALA
jgi:hypothetical protein